jgi:hypothetical protein
LDDSPLPGARQKRAKGLPGPSVNPLLLPLPNRLKLLLPAPTLYLLLPPRSAFATTASSLPTNATDRPFAVQTGTAPQLLHFLVAGMFTARIAKLPRLHSFRVLFLVLRRRVVAVLAIPALQRNDFSHNLPPQLGKPCALTSPIISSNTRMHPRRTGGTCRHPSPAYSMISVTAPAPTVCPPSRIANRKPFSSATGVIKLTSQLTLSPGITISTPAGNFTSPVTSVVRK